MASRFPPVPLDDFLAGLPEPKREAGDGGPVRQPDRRHILDDEGWMWDTIDPALRPIRPKRKRGQDDDGSSDELEPHPEIEDVDDGPALLAAEVYAALSEARSKCTLVGISQAFTYQPVGTDWTVEHLGVAYDAYRGFGWEFHTP